MYWKILRGLLALTLLLALAPAPAMAQEGVTIIDSCAAVDHFPADPVSGAPSLLTLIFVLSGFDQFIGHLLTANVTGASGDVSGSGVIDMYGVVVIPVPLYQYGPHELSSFASDHPGLEHVAGAERGGTLIVIHVDDSESTCDEGGMRAAAAERMAAATATTTSTTTTTSSTTSTSSSTSTTTSTSTTATTAPPAGTDPPEPAVVSAASETTEPGGGVPIAAVLIGFGALIALLGGWMLFQSGPGHGPPTDSA